MTFGELFAGIGGFSLGLERAGMRCKWQVEIDPYAQEVLRKHWPDVPKHDDVRTFPPEGDYSVDLICGGFPCQDISVAGNGAGLAGARSGLWYEFARIIRAVRPRWVVIENVPALTARGLGTVLGDLAEIGMDAEWHCIPACSVGAPHRRDRIWIVGVRRGTDSEADASRSYTNGVGLHREKIHVIGDAEFRDEQDCLAGPMGADVADADSERVRVSGCSETACTAGGSESKAEERQRIWPDASASCECCDVSDAHGAGRQQQRRPEPVRAEQPAVECGGWWESEPDVGRAIDGFSSWLDDHKRLTRQSHERIMAYVVRTQGEGDANAKKKSAAEIMRSLRDCFGEENVQRSAGRSVCVSASEVLLTYLRKLEEGICEEGNASLEGQEDEGSAVRGLRPDDKPSRTSHRPRRNKQHAREYSNTLQDLSRLLALDSQAAWVAYRRSDACPRLNWESGIPRVAHGVPSRVDRLRCLGNAVVPQVVEIIGRAILEAEARMTA